jgi:hypothetical protein
MTNWSLYGDFVRDSEGRLVVLNTEAYRRWHQDKQMKEV